MNVTTSVVNAELAQSYRHQDQTVARPAGPGVADGVAGGAPGGDGGGVEEVTFQ